jgi:hypothetical protein
MVVWDGTNVQYTDSSTPDLGASTLGVEFSSLISGSDLILKAIVTTGTWNIKVGARVI